MQKRIQSWEGVDQLKAHGFRIAMIGAQASLRFESEDEINFLSLRLASSPANSHYVASRITEKQADQQIKPWQATEYNSIVMEFSIRFGYPTPPPGLIENIGLWNVPLPPKDAGPAVRPAPMTAIGISRSYGEYVAVVTQDLDLTTLKGGIYLRSPLPPWLDPCRWHSVRTVISTTRATIEVAQDKIEFTPALLVDLLHPPEPLVFEISIDNDNYPHSPAPVMISDKIDVSYLNINTWAQTKQ